jgi:spore coat protein H
MLQWALFLPAISASFGQGNQIEYEPLDLSDRGNKIQNTICIDISASEFENIKAVTGSEISVTPKLLVINNDTLTADEIRTRGQTTLYYRRKSYSFDLQSEASFHHGKKTRKFKKFYLLSLSMDRNYANNHLAFEMMETSKLFHLFYAYCELQINGQSEGVCMIMERPDYWAMQKNDSPLLIRRGYNSSIEKLKTGNKTDKEIIKKYRADFRDIYRSLDKYEGEELYRTISSWLETDDYMKWLAFNYFIRNGDYTDEVYFYADPGTGKFNVIPWDYDDIFSVAPHEGYEESRKITGDKLFFSAEDQLDKKIVTDPYLYKMYLVHFEELLNELSPDVLKHIIEKTYAELYPYYSDAEIISQSKYDRHQNVNLEDLKKDLSAFYDHLVISRGLLMKTIAIQIH